MFNWLFSALGSLAGFFFNRLQNRRLTGKEREQNAFNAEQAAIQRSFASSERVASQEFNAFEAEKTRQFQADQAATQWQRGVADMRAAGLNPALAYGQGGASAMQGVTASSSPASGAAASGSTQLQGLSDILQLARFKKDMESLDEDIKNKRADRSLKEVETEKSAAERDLTRKQVVAFDPMNDAQLGILHQELSNKKVQELLGRQHISESEARTQVDLNNALLASIDAETRHDLNTLNVRLRVAQIGEVEGRIERITAEINELYSRAILQSAQKDMMSQETKNLAIQEGILRLDKDSHQFTVDHLKADRNWRIAGQVVQSVTGVAGTVIGGFGAAGLVSNARTNAARLALDNVAPYQVDFAYPGSTSYGRGYSSYSGSR